MATESGSTGSSITPSLFVIERDELSEREVDALLEHAVFVQPNVVTIRVTGPAMVECMQGLLTNDLTARGPSGFIYGAVLTPKGMIICDLWVACGDDELLVFAPAQGRIALLDVFRRSLPPRLARYADVSGDTAVMQLAGPKALDLARAAGLAVPDAGETVRATLGATNYVAARPVGDGPFALHLSCDAGQSTVRGALRGAGGVEAGTGTLELMRILTGFPRLGAEIDSKTLPQEARFEEIEGVSYTKGCYTGQETVARVHFRGHTNRRLIGLRWEETPSFSHDSILAGDKTVGRVTSAAWLFTGFVGLAMVRRELAVGAVVTAAGAVATIVSLPQSPHG